MRRFARVGLGEDTVPDALTILCFRHLLDERQLTAQMFAAVKTLPTDKRLLHKAGTIVDAKIIAAPSSTKSATGTLDPEMKQTRKGQQWFFGMKIHVGTDTRGLVHSLTTTDAAQADIAQLPYPVHGQETTLYGYYKADDKRHWEEGGGRYRVNKSGNRTRRTDAYHASRSRIRKTPAHRGERGTSRRVGVPRPSAGPEFVSPSPVNHPHHGVQTIFTELPFHQLQLRIRHECVCPSFRLGDPAH